MAAITPSPQSHRTPQFTIYNNTADCIERALVEDGHRTWGFVIYRCTYSDDAAWTRLLQTLTQHTHDTLKYYNGLDLINGNPFNFQLTVIEDRPFLDGVTTATVRAHFKQWATDAVAREQGGADKTPGLSQRYRYCIRVDAAGLQSHAEEEDNEEDDRFVDLIWKDWEPSIPDPRERPEPAVEGCTRPDVGWMRVATRGLMVDMYDALRDQNAWYSEYRRPDEVVCR